MMYPHIDNSKTVTLIANNWDRFGGRALDILNGYVLAKKFGCKFAFYWPDDHRFPEMQEQIWFFSEEFIREHRIECAPEADEIEHVNFNEMSFDAALSLVFNLSSKQFFRNPDFFSLPKFLDETLDEAQQFFSFSARQVISPKSLKTWNELRAKYSQYISIHGRYGDLVNGSFNQYVDPRKYVETISLTKLIKNLYSTNERVVLLSDTAEISRAIEKIVKKGLQPFERVNSDAFGFTEYDLQNFELLTLASSKCIYASSSSAFSILASRIGNVPIKSIRDELETRDSSYPSFKWIGRFYLKFNQEIRSQVISRDVLSVLDFYWKKMKFKEIIKYIEYAHKVNSDYVLSLCTTAIILKLRLKRTKSLVLIEHAEEIARSRVSVHHDPLVLTLLVKYSLLRSESGESIDDIRSEIASLNPYQFSKQKALDFLGEFDSAVSYETEKYYSRRKNLRNWRKRQQKSWEQIVKSEEKDFIYGLLRMLNRHHLIH